MTAQTLGFAKNLVINRIIASYFARYEIAAAGYAPQTATTLMWCIIEDWIEGFRAVYRPEFATSNHLVEALRQKNHEMTRTLCQDILVSYEDIVQIVQFDKAFLTEKMKTCVDYNRAIIDGAGATGDMELVRQTGFDIKKNYNTAFPIINDQPEILGLHLTARNVDNLMIQAISYCKLRCMQKIHEHPNYMHTYDALLSCLGNVAAFRLYYSWYQGSLLEIFRMTVHRNPAIAIMLWNKNPDDHIWMKNMLHNDLQWLLF